MYTYAYMNIYLHIYGGVLDVIATVVGNGHVQILDKVVYISDNANTFEKGMNLTIFLPDLNN